MRCEMDAKFNFVSSLSPSLASTPSASVVVAVVVVVSSEEVIKPFGVSAVRDGRELRAGLEGTNDDKFVREIPFNDPKVIGDARKLFPLDDALDLSEKDLMLL